jgi:diaminopimelate epimerase
VVFPEGLAGLDVRTLGRALRTHPHFAPAGANVNFARVDAPDAMTLRTYERGVENETYACGTGAAATVLVANALGLVGTEVRVTTSGGEILQIGLENGTVFLEGPAVVTYQGQMFLDSLGLTLP